VSFFNKLQSAKSKNVLMSEIINEKERMCENGECKNRTKFHKNDLVVRCMYCYGCYHPACVASLGSKLASWKDLMSIVEIREKWKFVCEFCKKKP
jgi:hypothetical protein